MTEVMLANLGCFGVTDNLAERSSVTDTSVKDCSVSITEQSHRVVLQMAENGGATFTWFVTITADPAEPMVFQRNWILLS